MHPHKWEGQFREDFAKAIGIDPDSLRGPKDLAHFDVITTNPPFGSKLPIKDRETLGQYKLGHVWKPKDGVWTMTNDLQSSVPPEILFIERCWQLLKPGGRLAIVLPDAILGAPGLLYVRYWMLTHCKVIASIDLHPDTFQPRNGTQTSVLLLQRKTDEEISSEVAHEQMADYDIFMAQLNAMGHDKRGNTVYKRNEDGEEILAVVENPELIEFTAGGETTIRPMPRRKVVDDDTPLVADEFIDWKAQVFLGW